MRTTRAPKIICLLWHPLGDVIRDGGLRRTYEIIYACANESVLVIDRYPTIFSATETPPRWEYRIPQAVTRLRAKGLWIGATFEAALTAASLFALGAIALIKNKDASIYVPTSELPWVTLPGFALSRLFGRRLVLTNQNTAIDRITGLIGPLRWLLWRTHQSADLVIAVSHALATELVGVGVNAKSIAVNGNGYDVRPHKVVRPTPKHAGIFIGRLERIKGTEDLLQVWQRVNVALPAAKLRLVGYGSPDAIADIVSRCRQLGIDHTVQLLGVVSDEGKWDLLAESRVCIFLSRVEGWGLVPVESISIGLPVLVYDLPCYYESLSGLRGIWRVPLGDIDAAAQYVIDILCMPDSEYGDLSHSIRSSFAYRSWKEVADSEMRFIKGQEDVSQSGQQ